MIVTKKIVLKKIVSFVFFLKETVFRRCFKFLFKGFPSIF